MPLGRIQSQHLNIDQPEPTNFSLTSIFHHWETIYKFSICLIERRRKRKKHPDPFWGFLIIVENLKADKIMTNRKLFSAIFLIFAGLLQGLPVISLKSNDIRPEYSLLQLLSVSFDPRENENVSAECLRDFILYHEAVNEYEPWALRSKFY